MKEKLLERLDAVLNNEQIPATIALLTEKAGLTRHAVPYTRRVLLKESSTEQSIETAERTIRALEKAAKKLGPATPQPQLVKMIEAELERLGAELADVADMLTPRPSSERLLRLFSRLRKNELGTASIRLAMSYHEQITRIDEIGDPLNMHWLAVNTPWLADKAPKTIGATTNVLRKRYGST